MNQGVDAIFEVLTGAYLGTRKVDSPTFPPKLLFILVIMFIIIFISISKNKRGGGKGIGGNRHGGFDIWDAIILSNMGRGSYGGLSSGSGWGGGELGGGFGGGAGGGW